MNSNSTSSIQEQRQNQSQMMQMQNGPHPMYNKQAAQYQAQNVNQQQNIPYLKTGGILFQLRLIRHPPLELKLR